MKDYTKSRNCTFDITRVQL